VQQVAELLIGSERLPQLLQRPISRRVARDIEVQQSSGAVVHHHKDVDLAEGRGDGHEEVTTRPAPIHARFQPDAI
jgi:hypothetical protein